MKNIFCVLFCALFSFTIHAQYQGTAYPNGIPHPIPGMIQAEHFDNGGEGISWHDVNPGQSDNAGNFRPDTDVEFNDLGGGNYGIGWSSGEEWLKYTVNVAQSGFYKAYFRLAAQNDHSFAMKFDETEVCRFNVNTGSYGNWQEFVSLYIEMPAGIHVLTVFPDGADVDLYTFKFVGSSLTENSEPKLKISELMSNNVSAIMDESYNYSMWVELHNYGSGLEILDHYYFTDNLQKPKKWSPKNQWIPAGQFKTIWFEREELPEHSSFKLEPEGASLYLLDENANIIDHVRYYKQYRNVSYGRTDDTGNEWAYFTEYSPTQSNSDKKKALEPACANPGFSISGGFYNSPVNLSFIPANNVTVYYTTDGSEPTQQSTPYVSEQTISLNKTTCVRAIAISDTHLPSKVITNTYFINERNFTLPVVSLVTEAKNLKDDMTGIYVEGKNGLAGNGTGPANWNQDWDRPANLELYDTTGIVRINQEIDISISGGWSRAHPQKSLKFSPRKKFGDNRLRYDFFASKLGNKYKDIQFRNSGNDFWNTMMRDALMQSLIIGRMDIDYLAYEPAVCFINGEYYGIQNLRERSNKDYLYSNYGLDETEFVLIDHAEAPNYTEYITFLNYLINNNLQNSIVYQNVQKQLDIDSYSYYMMAQMYYANTDWPHNNYKIWKKNDGSGRWRWILYDTDFGFSNNQDHNSVTYVLQSSDDKITTPLRRLLTNTSFKNQFLTRYAIHLSSTFEPNRVCAFIDSLSAKIRPEMPYHKQRWGGNNFENELNTMKTFAKARTNKMMEHLSSYFFRSVPICDLYLRSNRENSTYLFNNETITDNSIRLRYFKGQTVNIEASEVLGCRFSHWEMTSVPADSTLIASTGQWRYWDDYGQPAGDWKALAYDDNAWKIGNAPLGYGKFSTNTTIGYGNNADNKYSTAYFRKTITLNNWTEMSAFRFSCFVDDGLAVYVNGREIDRTNLPAGNLAFNTFTLDCNDGINAEWTIPKEYFQEGKNTIAVEVHQCNASSSDLVFSGNLLCQTYSQSTVQTITTPVYSAALNDNISLKAVYESIPDGLQTIVFSPVQVYSLPVEKAIQIINAAGNAMRIYDLTGRPVYQTEITDRSVRMDISFLQPGLYIVSIDNQSFKILR